MTFGPIHTSAYAAFVNYNDFGKAAPSYATSIDELIHNISYTKRTLKSQTMRLCDRHKQPDAYAPVIYSIANGIRDFLINASLISVYAQYSVPEMATDLLEQKKDSLIMAQVEKSRLDYLLQNHTNTPTSQGTIGMGVMINPVHSVQSAEHLYNISRTMTAVEYDDFMHRAESVEQQRHSACLIGRLRV